MDTFPNYIYIELTIINKINDYYKNPSKEKLLETFKQVMKNETDKSLIKSYQNIVNLLNLILKFNDEDNLENKEYLEIFLNDFDENKNYMNLISLIREVFGINNEDFLKGFSNMKETLLKFVKSDFVDNILNFVKNDEGELDEKDMLDFCKCLFEIRGDMKLYNKVNCYYNFISRIIL
uniref:Uncharacterized protein n=1 Tax=Pithovirus LCPAC104 TaxID=2506589 RepID=A0A481Z403_9VIRU|nr:MAG: hypothetical protein LCPAC104_00020 [Pithovirus LCPAC104]